MDDNDNAAPTSSAALIGWGLALLGVGAALLVSDLRRSPDERVPGLALISTVLLIGGWALFLGGMVTLARRVDRLAQEHDRTTTPQP